MRTRIVILTLTLAWSITSGARAADAQQLAIGGGDSNYGSVSLSPGFTPDPHSVSVISGGDVDVAGLGLGSGCVGYATRQPDFIVKLGGSSSRLRFYHEGDGDTGLVINDPSGSWHCNDDSYGGISPTVDISGASSGQYDVWITSYSSGDNITGTLSITELDRFPGSATGSSSSSSLSAGGTAANYGSVTLSPGFSPDPHTVSVTSGGRLDVAGLNLGSGCVGYATGQPDFIVHLTGQTSLLRFFVNAGGDTGLVVNDPSGTWRCNDDSHGGVNPTVDITNARSGQYDVWITSYSSGDNITGTLHVTELASQRPKG
jgi:serine protease Do